MTAPSPVAVAYVCAPEGAALERQREVVTDCARHEGLALAQIVTDLFDCFTISQVVDAARLHDARLVIVPADARLATVKARVTHELAPHGAACIVIGGAPTTQTRRPRLTDTSPQRRIVTAGSEVR